MAAGQFRSLLLASQLIPPGVFNSLANLTPPDAEVFGGSLAVNPTTPILSLSGFAGREYLVGLGTFETAWYGYFGAGATVGSASRGVAIAGYTGFAWNCPNADAYTDVA